MSENVLDDLTLTSHVAIAGFYRDAKIIIFKPVTPLHVGAGRGLEEAVDLPLQRDNLGLPVIWGSSIKGALRSVKELMASTEEERARIESVFGPRSTDYASSMAILDAKLLAIPARSLRGVYVYVTSRHLLEGLRKYLEIAATCRSDVRDMLGAASELVKFSREVEEGRMLLSSSSPLIDGRLVVNEAVYEGKVVDGLKEVARVALGAVLSDCELDKLAIASDADIRDIVRTSLVVLNRIRLNPYSKTVERGGLWSEEYLPPNSLLITLILYSKPRGGKAMFRDLDEVWDTLNPGRYLVLGGDETVGKGVVEVITL